MTIRERGAVTYAEEGRTFTDPRDNVEVAVVAGCRGNEGRWYCIDHDQFFPNNLTLDGHTGGSALSQHVLVWWCFEHGPEVP